VQEYSPDDFTGLDSFDASGIQGGEGLADRFIRRGQAQRLQGPDKLGVVHFVKFWKSNIGGENAVSKK